MFNCENPKEEEFVNEEKELIESLLIFTKYLISKWPQIDSSTGNLNYYIAGSLSPILLSQVNNFTELDSEKFPQIKESSNRTISPKAKSILTSFVRKIGDLDYIPLGYSKNTPKLLKISSKDTNFEGIPPEGQIGLIKSKDQIKLICDPVEVYGSDEIAKISINNQDFYINRPDNLYAYKLLNLLENYPFNPSKFNRDFPILHQAFLEIYTRDELLKTTNKVLNEFEADMERFSKRSHNLISSNIPPLLPTYIKRALNHPDCSTEIRQVLLELESFEEAESGRK
jgi:hypothetical protein